MTVALVDSPAPRLSGSARGWVDLLGPVAEIAKTVAPTEFVPSKLRHNVPAITACILYGDEVGLGPMQSLAKIAVIDGRPFMAAESQRALVLAAGHEIWPEDWTATRCTWVGRRRDRDGVTRVEWTLDDARRAGISGKQNWRAYPRQMLSARASADLVRAIFADVVGGIAAVEEIDEFVVESDGGVANGDRTDSGAKRRRRRVGSAAVGQSAPAAIEPAAPAGDLPPLPDDAEAPAEPEPPGGESEPEPEPAMMTDAQRRRLFAAANSLGVTDRGDRLRYTSAVLGRVVVSWNEVTAAEADRVLDDLERLRGERSIEGAPDDEQGSLVVDEPEPEGAP